MAHAHRGRPLLGALFGVEEGSPSALTGGAVNERLENVAVWPGMRAQFETLHRGRLLDVGFAMQALSVNQPGQCGPTFELGGAAVSLDQCGCRDRRGRIEPNPECLESNRNPLERRDELCGLEANAICGGDAVGCGGL